MSLSRIGSTNSATSASFLRVLCVEAVTGTQGRVRRDFAENAERF